MHEPELHDLSDDADYAASIQQGSASMTRSDSRRLSSPSVPEGADVVYSKENVAIHPTQYASERISGRLKLIKQGNSLFMTWIPYKGQSSNARLSEKDKNLYTIRAVPFSDIRSIRRHTPTLGWQYIIVVMSSGLAFPPLYFYNGGVREFLATVKQHVLLVRSVEDANVFLVNDFENPLQVWTFLLGYHAYDSTYAEREYLMSVKKAEYETIKRQWQLVELLDKPLHHYFERNDCLNYFFCFRWILIQFKREFEYEKTMRLWEVMWTHHLSEHLHLYVCVAILKRHRKAEALCICAGENGEACIPPGTPPSLPIEDGLVYPQLEDDIL
ncbi:TBC1 domain family member 15 [Sesamum angolense]|uniref:TBC1 domain family member 15 n=1 Tax=Sesamum angolense TaxID=2727404 RepID=A0AAE2C0F7_9LAMI|nr:TBC1 domain family member 15 [Sesamum angolense]